MLTWNVFYNEYGKIKVFNIFEHTGFLYRLKEIPQDDKDTFLKEVDMALRYFFWAKYEWEVTIWNWVPKKDFDYLKIDVYDQVHLNAPQFFEYVWTNKERLHEV